MPPPPRLVGAALAAVLAAALGAADEPDGRVGVATADALAAAPVDAAAEAGAADAAADAGAAEAGAAEGGAVVAVGVVDPQAASTAPSALVVRPRATPRRIKSRRDRRPVRASVIS